MPIVELCEGGQECDGEALEISTGDRMNEGWEEKSSVSDDLSVLLDSDSFVLYPYDRYPDIMPFSVSSIGNGS